MKAWLKLNEMLNEIKGEIKIGKFEFSSAFLICKTVRQNSDPIIFRSFSKHIFFTFLWTRLHLALAVQYRIKLIICASMLDTIKLLLCVIMLLSIRADVFYGFIIFFLFNEMHKLTPRTGSVIYKDDKNWFCVQMLGITKLVLYIIHIDI